MSLTDKLPFKQIAVAAFLGLTSLTGTGCSTLRNPIMEEKRGKVEERSYANNFEESLDEGFKEGIFSREYFRTSKLLLHLIRKDSVRNAQSNYEKDLARDISSTNARDSIKFNQLIQSYFSEFPNIVDTVKERGKIIDEYRLFHPEDKKQDQLVDLLVRFPLIDLAAVSLPPRDGATGEGYIAKVLTGKDPETLLFAEEEISYRFREAYYEELKGRIDAKKGEEMIDNHNRREGGFITEIDYNLIEGIYFYPRVIPTDYDPKWFDWNNADNPKAFSMDSDSLSHYRVISRVAVNLKDLDLSKKSNGKEEIVFDISYKVTDSRGKVVSANLPKEPIPYKIDIGGVKNWEDYAIWLKDIATVPFSAKDSVNHFDLEFTLEQKGKDSKKSVYTKRFSITPGIETLATVDDKVKVPQGKIPRFQIPNLSHETVLQEGQTYTAFVPVKGIPKGTQQLDFGFMFLGDTLRTGKATIDPTLEIIGTVDTTQQETSKTKSVFGNYPVREELNVSLLPKSGTAGYYQVLITIPQDLNKRTTRYMLGAVVFATDSLGRSQKIGENLLEKVVIE